MMLEVALVMLIVDNAYATSPGEASNRSWHQMELNWGPQKPFVLSMYQETTFSVEYTVFCDDKSDRYSVRVLSKREVVFTVRQADNVTLFCTNATDILTNVTSDVMNVISVMPLITSRSNHLIQRHGLRGNLTVTLYGVLLGRAQLDVTLSKLGNIHGNDLTADRHVFSVVVFKQMGVFDTIFRISIYIFLVFITLAFGCKLDLDAVKENLRRPIAPAIGFGCQYILMPMVSGIIELHVTPVMF